MLITRPPATPPHRDLPAAPSTPPPAPQAPQEPKDYAFLGFSDAEVRTMGVGAAEGATLTLLSRGAEAVGLGLPMSLAVSAYGGYRAVLENRDSADKKNPVLAALLGVGKMQFMTGYLGWNVGTQLTVGSIAGAYYAHTEGPLSGKRFLKGE